MGAPHRHRYAVAMLLMVAMHCAARQVHTEPELEEAVRRAKADEEKGWQALELTIRPKKEEEADIEMQRRALAELAKIPSPRSQKMLSESATDRHLRGEAVQGLMQQRNEANKAEIDRIILQAARTNAQEFGGLSKEEIRALGEIDDPEAVRLLKQQLGRDPVKDDLVIESLGKILRRQKRSYSGMPAALVGGVQLQIEDISSTNGENPTAITPETAKEEADPEKVLLDFLATDAAVETKDKAIQNIADAHAGGAAYLLDLAAKNTLATPARIAIIDYLTRDAVNREDKSIIGKLAALKRRSNNRELNSSIDLSLRVLAQAFGVPTATSGGRVARRVAIAEGYGPVPKEADIITLKQRPYPEYSAADVKTNLKKALRHYRLGSDLVERMQRRIDELVNLPENRQSSERNLIFAALGRLYPQRDFYVLKEQSKDAFSKPGYFTTTLRLVTSSARGRSWQIAVLQRIWGLTYTEADILRQIYLRDGKLLQQRMRL